AITIPLSLLTTFILMRYFNVSGNLMSLGALDFGIIIDGAVIVMDNCVRFVSKKAKEHGRPLSREEIKNAVLEATIEIRSAAGFGQMIIIVVFLPIFALTGVEAKMFVPMAAAFCFALGSAFIFSFTTIPALAANFLSGNISSKQPWIMTQIEKVYNPIIHAALKMKLAIVGVGVGAIAAGIILFSFLGSDFLPQLDEGSIAVQFVRPTNISIDQSVEMQKLSEKVILEFPEVSRVLSRIGTAEVATDPMGPNLSDT
ncbi:MAG: efflux RND transporter permease subunit, partial [Bdellovibrionales bacterium]|nr:efflux RND transporter permease subunit [Bdellovibrionales bacterium]